MVLMLFSITVYWKLAEKNTVETTLNLTVVTQNCTCKILVESRTLTFPLLTL